VSPRRTDGFDSRNSVVALEAESLRPSCDGDGGCQCAQSTKYRKLEIWWWSPAADVPDIWAPFVSDWQQLGGLKNAGRSREEGGVE